MERVMSVEERIRRAEDIYNRRNGIYSKPVPNEEKIKNKSKKRTAKRLFMQMFVCLFIYIIFYAVTNRNYIFSEEFRNSVNTFFSEKIHATDIYSKIKNYVFSLFEENKSIENQENEKKDDEKNITEENKTEENKTPNENQTNAGNTKKEEVKADQKAESEKKDENIGGATESNEKVSQKKDEELTEQQLMEKDAKEIKKSISFIAPLKGRISSAFGWRNPTTNTVPKYHTGIDIAAVEGTKIKSATDGKVIMASSTGDYGNHYQIQVKNVILVYAHCKKLYLKEGDTVKQGQEIAEVGSTGNSTGSHLHFEIRKNGRKIDPQLVLEI